MYRFVDRPLSTLDRGSRILVWAMRSWVAAMQARTCPVMQIGPAFAQGQVMGALQPFLEIMAVLNRHGRQTFGFCDRHCPDVGEAEAIILALLCAARSGDGAELRQTVTLLVAEQAVTRLIIAVTTASTALAQAGAHPCEPAWNPHRNE